MNKRAFLGLILWFFFYEAVFADEIIMTPETIAQQSDQMPEELKLMVDEFIERHPELLVSIIPTTQNVAMTIQEVAQELGKSMEVLKKENIMVPIVRRNVNDKEIVLPRNNFIIGLPHEVNGKNYTIVVAGPWHKLHALESYNKKGWFVPMDPDQDKKSPTYQTVTQAYHAKKCKEVIEKENITTFEAPEVYLLQIPNRSDINQHACDENSFIVRKFYKEPWIPLQSNLEYVSKLSPKELEELYKVTKGANLHFLGDDGNLMINKQNKHLAMRDVQGPNDQNPDHPFNGQGPCNEEFSDGKGDIKQYAEYKKNHTLVCAVCGFSKNILEQAEKKDFAVQDQWQAWRNSVVNDEDVSSMDEGLRNQLYECVRHKPSAHPE